jgi:hypothetical protein
VKVLRELRVSKVRLVAQVLEVSKVILVHRVVEDQDLEVVLDHKAQLDHKDLPVLQTMII